MCFNLNIHHEIYLLSISFWRPLLRIVENQLFPGTICFEWFFFYFYFGNIERRWCTSTKVFKFLPMELLKRQSNDSRSLQYGLSVCLELHANWVWHHRSSSNQPHGPLIWNLPHKGLIFMHCLVANFPYRAFEVTAFWIWIGRLDFWVAHGWIHLPHWNFLVISPNCFRYINIPSFLD